MTDDLPLQPGFASIATRWRDGNQLGSDTRAAVSLSRPCLIETSYDRNRARIQLNGKTQEESEVAPINTGDGPVTIGRTGRRGDLARGDFFRGDIAEILIYDRVLDEGECGLVEEYLNDRYALW